MRAPSTCAYPPLDEPTRTLRGNEVRIRLGRVDVTYRVPGQAPWITVAGQPLPTRDAAPAKDTAVFALAVGADSILVSDRATGLALLVPRDGSSLAGARALLWAARPDPRRADHFRVTVHGTSAATGALYVAQSFGHTTGWVPAVHAALAGLPEPIPLTAAIRRAEDAAHARRKAGGSAGLHVVPLHYSDSESATITPADVANPSRPELLNREAALLWIADNLQLAQAAAGAAAIVNDCRPETWILHQVAEHAQGREVALHAVRYAFEEFACLRHLARGAASSKPHTAVAELLAASAPAIHTRRELRDALTSSGTDPGRTPSVDFEAASREITGRVPPSGTIWYQAVNWHDLLMLESGEQPYVVIPPLGQPSTLSPQQAAERAGAVLARHRPALQSLFTPRDPRGVVLVSQGNGFSARSRHHWRAMLALAERAEETQFLFAGGSEEDRAWLAHELDRRPRPNVTLLGWIDEHWSTFLRALRAKDRAAFVCRPGLSSIGAALVNGIPPLLMPPDPLTEPDGTVDAITAEVAMERAVYAFQLERLYAARCPTHAGSPLPVLVNTFDDDQHKALATLRYAMEPDVQSRRRAAIDGYCHWSRVARLLATVLAREAVRGPLPIQAKRRMRDTELLTSCEPSGAPRRLHRGLRPGPNEPEPRAPLTEQD